MSSFLVAAFSFNPPVIRIIGPIRESTIEKLNVVLPMSTTSTRSTRAGATKFEYLSNPNHWQATLQGQFCDQIGICSLFAALMDALDEEGGWKLASTHSLSYENTGPVQQDCVEQYKLFFSRVH